MSDPRFAGSLWVGICLIFIDISSHTVIDGIGDQTTNHPDVGGAAESTGTVLSDPDRAVAGRAVQSLREIRRFQEADPRGPGVRSLEMRPDEARA